VGSFLDGEQGNAAPQRDCLLSVTVPVYNEEQCLEPLLAELLAVLPSVTEKFEIILVDDHSEDGSFELMKAAAARDARVRCVRLSANCGQYAAITCGLQLASGQAVVNLDADLQHPPRHIPEMVAKWREGYLVVNMVKRRTPVRSWSDRLARLGSALFYRVYNLINERPIPPDVSEFRLLDRRCLAALEALPESARFHKGLVPLIGFRQAQLEFEAPARHAGTPGYDRHKRWRAGWGALAAFPGRLLRLPLHLGVLFLLAAPITAVSMALAGVASGKLAWTLGLLVAGLLFVCLGVLGLVVAEIHTEVKRRPPFFIEERVGWEAAAAPPRCEAATRALR
jgi:polyisoprenyl-phosphate glycosyltransferase